MEPNRTNKQPEPDYTKPVAYDNEGRPLYAHPPQQGTAAQQAAMPQVVHLARPHDMPAPEITPEVRAKHDAATKKYPSLNLSEGEYIISAVRRHPIGMIPIFAVVGLLLFAATAFLPWYATVKSSSLDASLPPVAVVSLLVFLVSLLLVIGGFIAVYIYINNKFFLTNESVIQEIQHSLFSRHEQTVSLANIEDASYRQENIFEHLFNYGSIRLSTEGDETTYRFTYVANPKKHIATLNNAVEAFKNGRPVSED